MSQDITDSNVSELLPQVVDCIVQDCNGHFLKVINACVHNRSDGELKSRHLPTRGVRRAAWLFAQLRLNEMLGISSMIRRTI